MDLFDRKILALHQNDTRRSAAWLGARVGLSAAAVQRRLKALRASGAIRAEIAVLDARAVGVPITCVVSLTMVSRPAPAAHLDLFKRAMVGTAEVQQCYQVTGASDFILVVTASSMEDYGQFTRIWFEANEHVARYETHVVLAKVKVGLGLPIA